MLKERGKLWQRGHEAGRTRLRMVTGQNSAYLRTTFTLQAPARPFATLHHHPASRIPATTGSDLQAVRSRNCIWSIITTNVTEGHGPKTIGMCELTKSQGQQ